MRPTQRPGAGFVATFAKTVAVTYACRPFPLPGHGTARLPALVNPSGFLPPAGPRCVSALDSYRRVVWRPILLHWRLLVYRHITSQIGTAVLLLILTAAQTGCTRGPAKDAATGLAQRPPGMAASGQRGSPRAAAAATPAADTMVVELSEPTVLRLGPNMVRYEVKYRFTREQPSPDRWYTAQVELDNVGFVGMRQIDGRDMKSEGTIRQDLPVFKEGAGAFKIHLEESPGKNGPFTPASNTVTGTVKPGVTPAS